MKLLICLSNSELTLVISDRKRVISRSVLPAPVSREVLETQLAKVPEGTTAELVLDLLDEERFSENVARVMPWEQDKMLKRILRRRMSADALLYTRWVGAERSENGRAEKVVQVVSVTDTDEIDALLQDLRSLGVVVKHIYSLSELVADFVLPKQRKKREAQGAEIILIKTSPSSYRQILVVDGIVRLSRQIHLGDEHIEGLKAEQASFERFIMVQRLVPFGQSFHYTLVAWDAVALQALVDGCGLAEPETLIRIRANALINDEQQLLRDAPALALMLNRKLGASHFHPERLDQQTRQRQAVQAIWWLAGGLVLAAAFQGITLAVTQYQHEQVLMKMAQFQSGYLARARQYEALAELPARADDVKDSTEFVEAIAALREQPGMAAALINVSQVLAQYPELALKSLEWRSTGRDNTQNLVMRLGVSPGRTPLQQVSGNLARFMAALEGMDGVSKAQRGRIAIDADLESSLNVDLNRDESAEYEFEVRIDLNHDTAKS